MFDKIWYVVMVPMVYFAAAWCVVGIVVRILGIIKAPTLPPTLRIFPENTDGSNPSSSGIGGAVWDTVAMPTVLRQQPLLWAFLMVFHVALMLLLLAHLDLLPQVNIMSAESDNMPGNGAVGVLITVCLLYFLFRRIRSPVREVSVPADYLLLFLLLCIAVSGDVMSWGNSWSESGFVMTKHDFGLYLESLLRFSFADPREFLSGSHYAIIGTHVLSANLFLLVLPYSKIMHAFFAVPLNKLRRG